jgi:transposase
LRGATERLQRLGVMSSEWFRLRHNRLVPGRGEMTEAAWRQIEPLLPANGGRGGQWRDHRTVVNAILCKPRTGASWRDLPERYGSWKTAHERLRRWTADGTWDKVAEKGAPPL